MKKLHEVTIGQLFSFSKIGLKYSYDTINGARYATCNRKVFKYIGSGQYIHQVNLKGRYIDNEFSEILNSYTEGKGCNKQLHDEIVNIITNN
jgi:hypothetical protein